MRLDLGPVLRTLWRRPMVLALMVLEIAAGIMTISTLLLSAFWYGRLGAETSGLEEDRLILMTLYSPAATTPGTMGEQRRLDQQRAQGVPGVTAVTAVSATILEDRWSYPTGFAGRLQPHGPLLGEAVGWTIYTDDQVARALGLRFASGALARPTADADGAPAAILTRCLAERLFGPEGARVATGAFLSAESLRDVSIAGVVEDVTMRSPFVPLARCIAFVLGGQPEDRESRLVVRAEPGRRAEVLASLRALFGPDTQRRFVDVQTFDSRTGAHHRVGTGLITLLGFFGVVVGVVVLLGSLAATSFLVAQRRRQIGIRRALGATKGDIVGYFLVENSLAVAMGSLLGLIGTIGLFTLMRRVFDSATFDTRLVVIALVVTWVSSILATLVPALGAARVSPSVASRSL